jgi:hypothetical protein
MVEWECLKKRVSFPQHEGENRAAQLYCGHMIKKVSDNLILCSINN